MKLNRNKILISFLSITAATSALLSKTESAELLVQAQLQPFIAVTPASSTVQIASTSVGDFSGSFNFAVESNATAVSLYAVVTKLYKDTDPNNRNVKPVDVNRGAGVDILPFSARPVGGSDLKASFSSTTSVNKPAGIFEAYQTEQVNLESTQNGVFNQDVELSVTWTRDSSLRPAGVYGGYIQLFVSAIP